jgi:iron(III) transport system permease protein
LGGHAPLWTSFWSSDLEGEWKSLIAYKYSPIWNSFWVSIVVAIAGASLTLLIGYIVEKKRPHGDQILYTLSVLPAAIPGTVMGLGYILAFNKPYFFIYGTFWIIIINIIVCNLTLGVLSSIANLKQIDKSMEEAAVSLGASPMGTFYQVVFPLTRTAFFSNISFFFMRAMTTISAVIFLISAKVKLAAIEIIFLDIDGRTASANAMCTIIIVLVVAMLGVMRLITKRAKRKEMSTATA